MRRKLYARICNCGALGATEIFKVGIDFPSVGKGGGGFWTSFGKSSSRHFLHVFLHEFTYKSIRHVKCTGAHMHVMQKTTQHARKLSIRLSFEPALFPQSEIAFARHRYSKRSALNANLAELLQHALTVNACHGAAKTNRLLRVRACCADFRAKSTEIARISLCFQRQLCV